MRCKVRLPVSVIYLISGICLVLVTKETIRLSRTVIDEEVDMYTSIANVIEADIQVNSKISNIENIITWCSHCSYNHLHYIQQLAALWDGPISIAVFTYGSKIQHTLKYLSALHHCDANVKRSVSFHLCIPQTEMGNYIDLDILRANISCKMLQEKANYSLVNYAFTRVAYPNNFLRNFALKSANSQYVYNVDIDLSPSSNMYDKLLDFLRKLHTQIEGKVAFVLPSFETNVSLNTALSRSDLEEMWGRGTARPFYNSMFPVCQENTDYKRWMSLKFGDHLSVAYYRDWVEYWEPYMIVRRDEVPYFDETFNRYGFDRESHMCELYMSGFKFAVLDDGFLIHDGFKEFKGLPKGIETEKERNIVKYNQFKQVLLKRYASTGRTF